MARKTPNRDDELKKRFDNDDGREEMEKLFEGIVKGFEAQRDRSNDHKDNWDLYHCRLSPRQFYNGTSKLALPFMHDAVEARVTRFKNQLLPLTGRFVEVTTGEADQPQATQALLEDYVRRARVPTHIIPALLRNGDVEGMFHVYASWAERTRHIATRVMKQPKTAGMPNMAAEPVEDIEEDEITDAYPTAEVLSDADIVVLPAASNTIEEALEDGGSVTILRRWSKGKIKRLIRDKEIEKEAGEQIIEEMMGRQRADTDVDIEKRQLDVAGIKERGKVAVVYETWTKLQIYPWNEPRLCRIYFGGEKQILSIKLNPFWCDLCPLISAPVRKMSGVFKAPAPVSQVTDLQILANDTINEGADTAHYSAMPIVMTDPMKNPQTDTMILSLAAVWKTNPNDTSIVEFPELWASCLERCEAIQQQMFQTLSVNPAMIPQSTGGPQKKRSQAEVAMEQQIDLLTTNDAVTQIELDILSPLVQRFAYYDHQFRDKKTTIRIYGPLGEEAAMEEIPPIQLGKRHQFRWFGVEAARNMQQQQQQVAWLNIIKEIPPQQYPGYDLDLAPMMVQGTEAVFGPRLGRLIFKKKQLHSMDPVLESEMAIQNFTVPVHLGDDDQAHIAEHSQALQASGDPYGKIQEHIALHIQQAQVKAQNQMGATMPQQGGPGGGSGPRPGAQPAAQRPAQQPPGAVHKDQMARGGGGPVPMPRKM